MRDNAEIPWHLKELSKLRQDTKRPLDRLVMWRIDELDNGRIAIRHDDGSGCVVGGNENTPRTIPTEILYRLARDILDA